jgi:hypothetical protein
MSILIPDTVYKITCNESENIFQDEVFIKQFKHIACTESELDITVGGRSNEKDSPQPQVLLALGLLNTKPFPLRPPENSKMVPAR